VEGNMTEFDGSSEKLKKEMLDIIGKVKASKLESADTGAQTAARPLGRAHRETMKIVDAQPAGTPKPKPETPMSSRPVQAAPTAKVKPTTDTKKFSSKESQKTETQKQVPMLQQKQTLLSKETEENKPTDLLVGIESFYSKGVETEPKVSGRFKKIWESFIPRETICPYCAKPVLSIDNVCPHCGAVNI
jgi:hypothetical protein